MEAEFSRRVSIAKIKQTPSLHEISANDEERKKLADRFGLVALDRLNASVTLYRQQGDIRLEAELEADLVQPCVATLDPVPETVSDRFVLIYREGIEDEEADRLTLEEYDEEVVEPLRSEDIDIGEAVAQQLSLAMDPFPRSETAEWDLFEEPDEEGEQAPGESGATSPFDILSRLRKP